MNNKILLTIGGLLILLGFVRPNLSDFSLPWQNNTVNKVIIEKPKENLLDKCFDVIKALKVNNDRKIDGVKLSELANDLAVLIELDGEDEVIKTTEEIRQANSLVGLMLRLNIKGKYPVLAKASQDLIVAAIGDDSVALDNNLRKSAAEAFRALAWAYNEGSK